MSKNPRPNNKPRTHGGRAHQHPDQKLSATPERNKGSMSVRVGNKIKIIRTPKGVDVKSGQDSERKLHAVIVDERGRVLKEVPIPKSGRGFRASTTLFELMDEESPRRTLTAGRTTPRLISQSGQETRLITPAECLRMEESGHNIGLKEQARATRPLQVTYHSVLSGKRNNFSIREVRRLILSKDDARSLFNILSGTERGPSTRTTDSPGRVPDVMSRPLSKRGGDTMATGVQASGNTFDWKDVLSQMDVDLPKISKMEFLEGLLEVSPGDDEVLAAYQDHKKSLGKD